MEDKLLCVDFLDCIDRESRRGDGDTALCVFGMLRFETNKKSSQLPAVVAASVFAPFLLVPQTMFVLTGSVVCFK